MIFKDIPGYEGLYRINKLGQIFSVKYNRYLGSWITASGYVQVQLSCPRRKHTLHRLLALTFIPNPDNKQYINHKNGIRTDNRIENLEWVTPLENSYPQNKFARSCPHCGKTLYEKEARDCRK